MTVVRWHELASAEVIARLGTDARLGLSPETARRRLDEHGPNELGGGSGRPALTIAVEQLTGTMVLVLIAAAVVSAAVGDLLDAAAIAAIVVLNAALGFVQEYRAERAMAALKQMAAPRVRVRRGGRIQDIPARELVPGDVMLVEAGSVVAADARVVAGASLRAQEAALTGESEPVDKRTDPLPAGETPLADRRNMLFMGTVVTYGRGEAVVTGTGMGTEIGAIAATLQAVRRDATPLQRRLDELGRGLALAALIVVAVIFALGLARGEDLRLMFLTAVSMAVAAVPEGLPAVVTIALALGAQRMLARKALVRKLAAVETLGSVTVICTDKTGTLTENRMRVAALHAGGQDLDPDGLQHTGTAATLLLVGGALCSDALEQEDGGDPTELALVLAAGRAGLHKAELEAALPRVAELPFDADRKRMTTVHALGSRGTAADALRRAAAALDSTAMRHVAFTKGAADRLLDVCTSVWVGDTAAPLDDQRRREVMAAHDALAGAGMRVLGLALRPLASEPSIDDLERDLAFVGLFGMIDPPRAEAREAIATCERAGIRTVMITGDHPLTARAIAHRLGIADADVHARVSPEDKYLMVEQLQADGAIVAMTGDGVNDAPALKKADIGVAMGITGTDVAKEAADTVLLDDNFATIVAAVEEGRIIYDNIRKFVKYLLTTNSSELWLMLVAPLAGMPLPLLPLQVLWINLVTDGPTALTLGVEPAERGVMRRPPRPPGESVFAGGLGRHVVWVGVLMATLTLAVGYWSWQNGDAGWQTLVFTTLAFSQMAHVLAIRSERDSLFAIGLWSNRWLTLAVAVTILLQLAVVYAPVLQGVFDTVPLTGRQVAVATAVAAIVFTAVEAEKWLLRRRPHGRGLHPARTP